ncbi:hypothetical protein GOP47_0010663 [Adiantum capillus-veneris]|uniref:Nudix hydrolase domain-containing protein n=1 Tax=Adiantum capillus-veneris TaxID=13818 RepID=A0A9D4UVR1_ADICA|nr:hypothetical protein GOP47_0010663 [Adiantum capillus-veneris]
MADCIPSDGDLILAGRDDRYGGFIVDSTSLPSDPSTFLENLRHSLLQWKSQSKKGIWLKLPIENVDLVPLAVKEGFCYHHAEKDYLMLTLWIAETPSTLPSNASHQVGVGAMVINDENKVLVVQEQTGPTKGSGVWKMPTGAVLQGEDIKDAVQREVKEETGVDAELVEILGVRQAHDVSFGKSDLFFLCLLRPLPSDISVEESEIAAAEWISLDDYRSQEFNTKSSLLTRIADMVAASLKGEYKGFGAEALSFGFRNSGSYFYHNINDINSYLEQKKSTS